MVEVILRDENTGQPLWIDVTEPTRAELETLARDYRLHFKLVSDCLEVGHLPKLEKVDTLTFLILRAFDETSHAGDDSVNKITQKIAIFLGDRFLITVHRNAPPFLEEIRAKYRALKTVYLQMVLLDIMLAAVETYQHLLRDAETKVESFEAAVLNERPAEAAWNDVFRTKCRLTVTKRMLWHSMHVLQRFHPRSAENLPLVQDVRERVESLNFFAESLLDDLHNLQSIQLSLNSNRLSESSNRTNEVVRLLTVFSLFFLPMNFIVGVYGMNFPGMPELQWHHGYAFVWGLIISTVVAIYFWFRRRGWLRAE